MEGQEKLQRVEYRSMVNVASETFVGEMTVRMIKGK